MAITRVPIAGCPSKFDLLMALFGPEAEEDGRIKSKKPRVFWVEIPGGASFYFETLWVGKGYWDRRERDRCFYIGGRFWEDRAPTESTFVAQCWSRHRDGFMLTGTDDNLEVKDAKVYSDGKAIGSVRELELLKGFLHF